MEKFFGCQAAFHPCPHGVIELRSRGRLASHDDNLSLLSSVPLSHVWGRAHENVEEDEVGVQ